MTPTQVLTWTATSAIVHQIIAKLSKMYISSRIDSWKLSPETKQQVSSTMFLRYILSTINAIQSGCWGLYKFTQGSARWDDPTGNSESVALINGFQLADLLITDDWRNDKSTLLHHAVGIFSISGLLLGNIGETFMCDAELMELSSIFLNIMWFYKVFGKTNTKSYKIISVVFLLLFFVTRVVMYPLTLYRVREFRPDEWNKLNVAMKAILPMLWFLQLFWFRKIILIVKKGFSSAPKLKE